MVFEEFHQMLETSWETLTLDHKKEILGYYQWRASGRDFQLSTEEHRTLLVQYYYKISIPMPTSTHHPWRFTVGEEIIRNEPVLTLVKKFSYY